MRLIDLDNPDVVFCGHDGDYLRYNIWEELPTVDAVLVVRCKDCKHRPTKPDDYNPITTDGFALEFPDEECPCQCSDGWYSKYPSDDWFCPKGERKERMSDGEEGR